VSGFLSRVHALPTLGMGVSTEYGAGDSPGGLDVPALRRDHPRWGAFLELGVEVARGLDRHAEAWVASGAPTTYHFLDVNLEEREDFDGAWLAGVDALVERTRPAWLCGDAGLWHLGRRERGHMLLLPPILSADSMRAMAPGIATLRARTGKEVLPENPPGHVYLGDLHVLDAFAVLCEEADTGMLLDAAHLAIFQRLRGLPALAGFEGFPLERVVEIHVAGARRGEVDGYGFVEDDHTPNVLPETWEILSHVAARAPNLRAIVVECERNPLPAVRDMFAEVERRVAGSPFDVRRRSGQSSGEAGTGAAPAGVAPAPQRPEGASGRPRPAMPAPLPFRDPPRRELQRAVVRLLHDPAALPRIASEGRLAPEELAWLQGVDPRAWRADRYRAARVLTGLLEEYPATAPAHGGELLAFFGGARFHEAVREGRSLAGAFGAWLQDTGSPAVAALARVEAAIAAGRRAAAPEPGAGWVRAPGCAIVTGPVPAPYACEGDALVEVLPDGSARVEEAPPALAALLREAALPRTRADLLAAARALGADPGEDEDIVSGLVADGLLVPATASREGEGVAGGGLPPPAP
jgi:uncharacterized protein (UPF0276 family)